MGEIDKQSKIIFENGEIICSLPITAHTSKIRLKRNGEPFSTKKNNLLDTDLIEWQISYYKTQTEKEFIEIGEMLEMAYRNNLISDDEILEIKHYIENIRETFFEKYKFQIENLNNKFYDFDIFYRKFPFIRKKLSNDCFVEIEIKHKQRAVGFQSMLYIFIPLKIVFSKDKDKIIGRGAKSKERVLWKPTKIDIIETIKAFAIASKSHLEDIKEILNRISKS